MSQEVTVIDATNLVVGRLCSYVAKQSLLGKSFAIINVDKAMLTGNKKMIFAKFKEHREKGTPVQGPFIHRSAVDIFKRSLRRMLPFKTARGRDALDRVKAYKGVPARYKEAKAITLETANISKVPNTKYITLQEITKFMGGK